MVFQVLRIVPEVLIAAARALIHVLVEAGQPYMAVINGTLETITSLPGLVRPPLAIIT